MSQANVELVQRGFEAFNRRDFDSVLATMSDAITWTPLFTVEAPILEGKDALRGAWASQVEALDLQVEPLELISLDDVRVIAVTRWRGRGVSSGIPVDETRALIFTIKGGKAVRVEPYASKKEALEAVGVSQ
jgi:ketosteroid isomerase-like protein